MPDLTKKFVEVRRVVVAGEGGEEVVHLRTVVPFTGHERCACGGSRPMGLRGVARQMERDAAHADLEAHGDGGVSEGEAPGRPARRRHGGFVASKEALSGMAAAVREIDARLRVGDEAGARRAAGAFKEREDALARATAELDGASASAWGATEAEPKSILSVKRRVALAEQGFSTFEPHEAWLAVIYTCAHDPKCPMATVGGYTGARCEIDRLVKDYPELPAKGRQGFGAPRSKAPPVVGRPKQCRNDPCACGSGKKHKRCCGRG